VVHVILVVQVLKLCKRADGFQFYVVKLILKKMTDETSSAIRIGDNLENWMSLLPEALQNIPIIYLAIPG
jgi:hypothetical protein